MASEKNESNNGALAALPAGELRALVAGVAERAGAELPGPGRGAECLRVFIGPVVREMALALGDVFANLDVFLGPGGDVVTVDGVTGALKVVTDKRFVTMVDGACYCFKKNSRGEEVAESIGKDKAALILNCDEFLGKLRPLVGVRRVQLPVAVAAVGEHGEKGFRLLAEGYDRESGIYSIFTVSYRKDMSLTEAHEVLWKRFGTFPYSDCDFAAVRRLGLGTLEGRRATGRSYAVHVAAGLSLYCADLLPPGSKAPLFLYNANIPGAGKSIQAKSWLAAVHGSLASTPFSKNEEWFTKNLDSAAQYAVPYLFFDDLKGYIESSVLNSWITSPEWAGRKMGGNERFTCDNRAVNIMTGNSLELSEDLGRRCLIVDFQMAESTEGRVLGGIERLTESVCLSGSRRSELMGALYTLVREFYEPTAGEAHGEVSGFEPLASFEEWDGLVARMVTWSGLCNPTARVVLPDAGSNENSDRVKVVSEAVRRFVVEAGKESATLTLDDLAEAARCSGAFVGLLGTVADVTRDLDGKRRWPLGEYVTKRYSSEGYVVGEDMKRREPESAEERERAAGRYLATDTAKSFGRRMGKARGMVFEVGGRRWRFSKRESARASTFEVVLEG